MSAQAERAASSASRRFATRSRRLVYTFDLLRELVARDMKVRYKRTFGGVLWSLLNPLSQLLVLTFVFRHVLPLDIPQYSSSLFTGLIVWGWFSNALLISATVILDGSSMIRQPGFPSAILPVVTVTTHLILFFFALPILVLYLLIQGNEFTGAFLFLPVVVLLQYAFTLGLAYLVATLHANFRDTQYLLNIILMLGFWVTPVFYDASAIPARYSLAYLLNPMYHLIESYRSILLRGHLPSITSVGLLVAVSAALLAAGYTSFVKTSHRFAEQL